jgi:hypothetical protein
MERLFPMVPLAKNQAVCVGIMSYDGQVNFGLIGDYDAMEELDDLGADLEASLQELIEAAGGRRGIFRRFVPTSEGTEGADDETAVQRSQNGSQGGKREETAAD